MASEKVYIEMPVDEFDRYVKEKSLEDDNRHFLEKYSIEGDIINSFLWGKRIPIEDNFFVNAAIKGIDASFNYAPLSKNLVLYRGVKQYVPKHGYINKGYLSTTTSIDVAEGFTHKNCCFLTLHIEDGIPYIDMNKNRVSAHSQEDEILLPRDLYIVPFGEDSYIGTIKLQHVKVSKKSPEGIVPVISVSDLLKKLDSLHKDVIKGMSLKELLIKYPDIDHEIVEMSFENKGYYTLSSG